MRIALCLEYPIAQHGGTEVLVSELATGLAMKHQIILVSPDDMASLQRSNVAQAVTQHVSIAPAWQTIAQARTAALQIAQTKPDLVHFHSGGNYGWGNRIFWKCPIFYLHREIPRLSTNHGAFSILEGYCWEKRPLAYKAALLPPAWISKQVILSRLTCEVAVSQYDWRALRQWYPAMSAKFRWIYHSRLHGVPPAPREEREKVILCAGTIGPRKGQTTLVDGFSRIASKFRDWKLVLVGRTGDEVMFREIQNIIAREHLENQIQLLGSRSDLELKDWLQRAAIFAMPSTYEGLGLSLQEAQFYGCATVGTRCGGVEDLIQNGDNGLLVDVNSPMQLAAALEKLMSDPNLRQKFSRRGPESILEKEMLASAMVKKYETLYANVRAVK